MRCLLLLLALLAATVPASAEVASPCTLQTDTHVERLLGAPVPLAWASVHCAVASQTLDTPGSP